MGSLRALAFYMVALNLCFFVGRMKPRRGPSPQVRQPLYDFRIETYIIVVNTMC